MKTIADGVSSVRIKMMVKNVKTNKVVNTATLSLMGFITFYQATAFGGDITNTAAMGAVTGGQFMRMVNIRKMKKLDNKLDDATQRLENANYLLKRYKIKV